VAVSIHSYYDVALGSSNAHVERCGGCSSLIIQTLYLPVTLDVFPQHLARTVITHSIGDQYFEAIRWVVVRKDRIEAFRDITALVSTWHDDRDEGQSRSYHQLFSPL
jgi:hypothetical protein